MGMINFDAFGTWASIRAAQLDWNPIGFQFQLDWIGKLVGKGAGKSGSVQLDRHSNWKMMVQLASGRQLVNWQNDWIKPPPSTSETEFPNARNE